MSSLSVERALNCDGTLESVKVGVKRKRTPSNEEEEEKSEIKRKELPNGATTTVTSPLSRKEVKDGEKVVILDAGAQYGKVGLLCGYQPLCHLYLLPR